MEQLEALKILIIEDNPGDVLLLQSALEADPLSTFKLTAEETLAAGLKQLQQAAFDVVLVDLGLPDSAGLQTFEAIHRAAPNQPVVVFSGNNDEQQAVDAVRAGAQDYLVKSSSGFEMAARTIRYAIERQRNQAALRESETQFAAIFHSNPVGIVLTQLEDGRILDVNEAFLKIFGYLREQVIGRTTLDLHLYPSQDDRARIIAKLLKKGHLFGEEAQYQHSSGEIGVIFLSAEILELGGKKKLLCMMSDITERKQAENAHIKSELLLAEAQRVGRIGHWEWMAPEKIMHGSDEFFRILEIEHTGNMIPQTRIMEMMDVEDVERLQKMDQAAFAARTDLDYEYHIHLSGGRERWIHQIARVTYGENGQPLRMVGIVQDITERKQAEEKLRESEFRYRELFENINSGVAVYEVVDEGRDFIFKDFNRAGEKIDNDHRERLIGKSIFEMRPGIKEFGLLETMRQVWQSGQSVHVPSTYYQDDRMQGWYENFLYRISTNEIVTVFENITERKQAEDAIRRSEKRLRLVLETTSDGFWIVDPTRRFLDINDAYCAMSGYTRDELLALTIQDVEAVESSQDTEERIRKIIRTGGDRFETRHRRKDGSIFDVEVSVNILDLEQGQLICFCRDISKRKQAEAALTASENRFRALIERSSDGIMALSAKGEILYESPTATRLIGYPLEERQSWSSNFEKIHPDDLPLVMSKLGLIASQPGRVGQVEYRGLHKDGSIWWAESTATNLLDEPGVEGIVVNFRDVTERKQAEAALAVSQQRLTSLIEHAMDAIVAADEQLNVVIYNTAAEKMFGMPQKEAVGRPLSLFIPDQYHQSHREYMQGLTVEKIRNIPTNKVFSIQGKRANGETFPAESTISFVENKGQKLYTAIIRDVTERKQAEEKLRESEQFLKESQRIAKMGSWRLDLPMFKLDWSENSYRLLGFEPDEVEPSFDLFKQMVHPDDLQLIEDASNSILERPRPFEYEHRIFDKNGHMKWLYNSVTPIMEGDQAVQFIGIQIDITERKQAEEKLIENDELLRLAYEAANLGVWKNDLATGAIYFDDRARVHYGFSQSETTLTEVTKRMHPDDLPRVGAEIAAATAPTGNGNFSTEYRVIHPDGSVHWLDVKVRVMFEGEGETRHSVVGYGTSMDITERKQAEEQLRESEEKWRRLFEILPIGVSIVSPGDNVVESNPALAKILDYTPEELSTGQYRTRRYFRADNTLMPREEFPSLRAFKERQTIRDVEIGIEKENGARIWTSVSAAPFSGRGDTVTVTIDITERKQAEEKLRASEEKYRGLMETLDSVVATIDHDGRFLYMNDIAARQLGGTPQDLIGKTLLEVFPEPVALQQLEGVRQVIRTDKGRVSESLSFVMGRPRWYHNSLQPIHDENGQVAYALLHSIDIHELKSTQEQLAELNRTLEQRVQQATAEIHDLYDNAPAGYHSLDADGRFTQINQTELNWLGYARDEVIGRPFADFATPAGLAMFKQNFAAFKQRGWLKELEMEFKRKDGTTFLALVNATAIKDENGNFLTSRSTVFDITERKQVEEALKSSEAKYRLLFENMTEGFSLQEVINDESGRPISFRYLDANNSFEYHTGIHPQSVIGKNVLEVFPQIDPNTIETYGNVALGGKPIALEYYSTLINRFVSVRAFSPKRGQFATIFEDITERKQAEEALRESRDRLDLTNRELERASHAKDEFLANMSHELRTPLNGILGMSEILLDGHYGPLTERQLKYINSIHTSGKHLLSLINDVLDLSKIEADKLDLLIETVSVVNVCQASLVFVKEPALKKEVLVEFVSDLAVTTLKADERRLKQMLVNLLNNAVKFTPSGGNVTLEARLNREESRVELSVTDTGIGISLEDQKRLFNPFTQVDTSLTRVHEGTGLGLALVKRLAELHGGRVFLESELGKGSRFTISLPWQEPEARPTAPAKTDEADGASRSALDQKHRANILLAEDNPANVMTIQDYLEAKGFNVITAHDGLEALEKAAQNAPDLILMDIQMPRLDGLEATRRLRVTPQFAATPIIAVTAFAMKGDREKCIEAGATDYMSKPVQLKELVEKIEKLLGR